MLENAKLKIFDINLRKPHYQIDTIKHLLSKADILKINEEEIAYLAEEFNLTGTKRDYLQQLTEIFSLKLICLTLGDKGAEALYKDKIYSHNGYPVTVKDTVGAGDSFLATFISGYLKGLDIESVLDNACKVGAFVASQSGANPDYPEHLLK